LPSGLDPLPDAPAIRATDAWAIAVAGIPGPALMEAAGVALADAAIDLAPDGPVVVVCGAGSNGGDGYVAARVLEERGRAVRVVRTVPEERLVGDAAAARDRWAAARGRLPGASPWTTGALDGAALVVDAILGTGATGAPRGVAETAIDAIRGFADAGGVVLACDVPSGVDATTGEVEGAAVRADATVTFHAATPGLWIAPGKGLAGRVRVVDIGIPDGHRDAIPAAWAGLMTDRLVADLATRGASGTKFRSGHVVVVGGGPGMVGAPCLTARGAMRAGAGYVTVATPGAVASTVAAHAPTEALGLALPDDAEAAATAVLDALGAHDGTLVVGPGLGRGEGAAALARRAVGGATGPVVVDADGIAAFAGEPEGLGRTGPTVLTPHAGELARLLDRPTADVGAGRLRHARDAAVRSGAVVVLKGDDTLVVAPDGRTAISPGGVPGLATAGTGDVLAGIVGALVARGAEPFVAAAAGVRLHARAGELVADEHGVDGTVAGDVADAVGRARRRIERADVDGRAFR